MVTFRTTVNNKIAYRVILNIYTQQTLVNLNYQIDQPTLVCRPLVPDPIRVQSCVCNLF